MTSAFGTCAHCEADARVRVNGTPVCLAHMNREFRNMGVAVRKIAKRLAR